MSLKVDNLEPIVEEVVDDADVTVEELRYDADWEEEVWVDVTTGEPTHAGPRPDPGRRRPGVYRSDFMESILVSFGDGKLWEL